MAETKKKREFDYICPNHIEWDNERVYVTKIWVDKSRDMKVELPFPVPKNDDEAKEFYGPGASIDALVRMGVQIVTHKYEYQKLWADFMKDGLDDQEAANKLYDLSVAIAEINAPRAAKEPSKKVQDRVLTKLAKDMGISLDELKTRMKG